MQNIANILQTSALTEYRLYYVPARNESRLRKHTCSIRWINGIDETNANANAIGKVKKNAIRKRFFLHMSEKSCTFAAVFGKRKKL